MESFIVINRMFKVKNPQKYPPVLKLRIWYAKFHKTQLKSKNSKHISEEQLNVENIKYQPNIKK